MNTTIINNNNNNNSQGYTMFFVKFNNNFTLDEKMVLITILGPSLSSLLKRNDISHCNLGSIVSLCSPNLVYASLSGYFCLDFCCAAYSGCAFVSVPFVACHLAERGGFAIVVDDTGVGGVALERPSITAFG